MSCPECGAVLAIVGVMQTLKGFVEGDGYMCMRCHTGLIKADLIRAGLIDTRGNEV